MTDVVVSMPASSLLYSCTVRFHDVSLCANPDYSNS